MNGQNFHQHLLDTIESELAGIGLVVLAAKRNRMARLLNRIDQVKTRQGSAALCAELERELQNLGDEHVLVIGAPETWLSAAECA